MNESTDAYDGLARKIEPPKGKLGVLLSLKTKKNKNPKLLFDEILTEAFSILP